MTTDALSDLAYRGQIFQQTNAEGLVEHLKAPRKLYAGFDATAPSLTIGHLVPMLLLARMQRAGHSPVVVLGGGTAMIGDPSGKSAERPLLTPDQIAENAQSQSRIFKNVLDFSGSNAAVMVNNADWLAQVGFLEMLRDVGKHFSVNMMIQKDSVKERLTNREQGISYTEFSYMLLQAYDFRHLYDSHGVTLQIAGSDQWGNIVAGTDLIRRTRGVETFGVTAPLVTKADGGKFGKTESGAIWLTADRTSPYALYQFWLNVADADVERYLKTFTFYDEARITELLADLAANPGARAAQKALAAAATEIVHGATARAEAEATTAALFSGDVRGLSKSALEEAFAGAPSAALEKSKLDGAGLDLVELLIQGEVVKSKREAREFAQSGAISVNGERANAEHRVTTESLLHGELLLVRRGKKNWHVIRAR
ncbi:MAG: tyrosine--tRNA ligase [Myxococcota bacterium]|nr:tyrosine--tRNA ligase [Myxococcota bacterium]